MDILDLIPTKPLRTVAQNDLNFDRKVRKADHHLFKDFPTDLWNNKELMDKVMETINASNDRVAQITDPDYITTLVKEYECNKQLHIQKLVAVHQTISAQLREFIDNHAKYNNEMNIIVYGQASASNKPKILAEWILNNSIEYIVITHFVQNLTEKGWRPHVMIEEAVGDKLIISCDFN